MTTKSWVHVGTVTTWKGTKKNISLFSDDDTVAIGITDGISETPFISDTFTISKEMFTQMMGTVVTAVNGNKIIKDEEPAEKKEKPANPKTETTMGVYNRLTDPSAPIPKN